MNFFLSSPQQSLLPQPAVDALSDREAQLALRDEIENGIDFAGNDEFESSNGEYTKGSKEQ